MQSDAVLFWTKIDFGLWKVRVVPMKKHQIIEHITIEKVWYEGIGIAQFHDGKKLIVKWGALPGMECDLKVVKNYKDYAECHIVHIHHFAPEYEVSNIRCPHYLYHQGNVPLTKSGCGGCKRQIAGYDKQLELKHSIVKDSFRHYPHEIEITSVLPSPEIWGYRNKIEYSFGKFVSWKWEDKQILSDWSLGFHRQGMFGKIVDIDQCFLVDKVVNEIFQYCKKLLFASGFPVYDQVQQKGILRHLMVRQAKRNNQIMLILSVGSWGEGKGEEKGKIIELLRNDIRLRERVTTFVLITNDSLADVVATRDSDFETLRGEGLINEKLIINNEWLTFDISPLSFFQTNTSGAELLYSTAINMVQSLWTILWTVMDLYCGTGTIGLAFLKAWIGDKLIWIEEIESAVQDAYKNARVNWVESDYHFFAGKVEKLLQITDNKLQIKNTTGELELSAEELGLVIVDPPRSWLHQGAVDTLIALKAFNPSLKVCYISCNPVTLARDMKLLSESYKADSIQPLDMFPHTHHIENIVILK
jgi:23S rRNA (uracil1939-C5)-methyltransferase